MSDAIERLAAHLVETRFERMSPDAITAAKTFILDTFGVAIAGTTGPHVPELISTARGGERRVRIGLGSARLTPAPHAAMVNAYQSA